ncbi:MAG: DUF6259 domain-containing protein, partial [Microthrixaceae bacterium]
PLSAEPDEEPVGDIVELVDRYVRPADQVQAVPVGGTITVAGDVATIRTSEVQVGDEVLPISAVVTVQLVADAAESRWAITVENHTATRTVFAVTLPRLHGLRLGDRYDDDALVCPFRGGERFPRAVDDFVDIAEGRLSVAEAGQRRVLPRDGRYVYELPYAGRASMMWLAYGDADDGVYLASHDPEFPVTVLHADTEGPRAAAMNLELRTWVTVRPGAAWTSADFVVAATNGDWHWGAARYRAWFDEVVPLTFHGGARRETAAIYLPFMKMADGRVACRYDDLPALFERAAAAGVDQLMPYGWMTGGFDTRYPEFFPDLELGGPMAMARAHEAVHAAGGRLVTYLNSRIFNRRSVYFDRLGMPWAAKQRNGAPWTERYGAESFGVMCPGAEGWRRLLADLAESVVRAYGTDVVYYDQLSAMAVPCHDESHGHAGIGDRNRQYVCLLEQAAAACRRADPDVAFSIEQASDLYAPWALFQGTLGVWLAGTRFAFPELYKFTFPEVIGLSFVFYTRALPGALFEPFPVLTPSDATYWLCRDILTGAALGILDQNLADDDWWQELLALRKAAAPWMGQGAFRDDVDVLSSPPQTMVKTFQCDGAVLVGVYNPTTVSGAHVEVRCDTGVDASAFRLLPDGSGEVVPVTVDDGRLLLEVPGDLLSMTVVETRPG